jgi:DNA-binding transcriptional regulator LsrR (DeoR family)
MIDDRHHQLLAQVAAMYYEQEMTQKAIGSQLGLSRVKVYRLLKQARAREIVQIIINWPLQRDANLEKSLHQTFDLNEALVLRTTSPSSVSSLLHLGQLAARYLEHILTDGTTMAVCLGRTSYETVHAISPNFQAEVRVAQAVGSMPFGRQEIDSATLARELAQKLSGEVSYLTSPLMGDSIEASEVIRNQRDIKRTLKVAQQADVALTGVGNLDPAISGFSQAGFISATECFISATELDALTATGAVGDMAGQIYNLDGELHPCAYNRRVIGITLAELKRIPMTIAVAMGQRKAKAILGGLRTGAIDVLCTDDQAANEVLRLNGTDLDHRSLAGREINRL